jgi:hypothetical protein
MESEKDTEKYLIKRTEALGGMCRKFTCPNVRGVPDQVCFFPKGIIVWVEVKSEGKQPEEHQVREIGRLISLEQDARVVDTKSAVDQLIGEVEHELFRRL